jgi:hypothetical protein
VLTYDHSLQPTILNDNVNQFKVGLESDKGHFHLGGYFTLKVKTMTLMSHFFYPQLPGIKISGTIFLSLQQNLCKAPSTVIMTDIQKLNFSVSVF